MIYSFLLAIAALGLSILISLPLGKWMFKVMCPKANLKPLHAKTESFFRRVIGKAARCGSELEAVYCQFADIQYCDVRGCFCRPGGSADPAAESRWAESDGGEPDFQYSDFFRNEHQSAALFRGKYAVLFLPTVRNHVAAVRLRRDGTCRRDRRLPVARQFQGSE